MLFFSKMVAKAGSSKQRGGQLISQIFLLFSIFKKYCFQINVFFLNFSLLKCWRRQGAASNAGPAHPFADLFIVFLKYCFLKYCFSKRLFSKYYFLNYCFQNIVFQNVDAGGEQQATWEQLTLSQIPKQKSNSRQQGCLFLYIFSSKKNSI